MGGLAPPKRIYLLIGLLSEVVSANDVAGNCQALYIRNNCSQVLWNLARIDINRRPTLGRESELLAKCLRSVGIANIQSHSFHLSRPTYCPVLRVQTL
jgi:hypothetical protein